MFCAGRKSRSANAININGAYMSKQGDLPVAKESDLPKMEAPAEKDIATATIVVSVAAVVILATLLLNLISMRMR